MLPDEKKCRTYKDDQIEWSTTITMWLGRRWVIVMLQKLIVKAKWWSLCKYKQLQRACRRQGLKEPGTTTQAELNTNRKVWKRI